MRNNDCFEKYNALRGWRDDENGRSACRRSTHRNNNELLYLESKILLDVSTACEREEAIYVERRRDNFRQEWFEYTTFFYE